LQAFFWLRPLTFYKYLSEKQNLFANKLLETEDVKSYAEVTDEGDLEAIREESLEKLGYFLKPSEMFSAIAARGNVKVDEDDEETAGNFILEGLQSILNAIKVLGKKIAYMISTFTSEAQRFAELGRMFVNAKARDDFVDGFVTNDTKRVSWSRSLKSSVGKGTKIDFDPAKIKKSCYRPFSRQWLYFDRKLNEVVYQMPRIFPDDDHANG
jgi:predicted helicase